MMHLMRVHRSLPGSLVRATRDEVEPIARLRGLLIPAVLIALCTGASLPASQDAATDSSTAAGSWTELPRIGEEFTYAVDYSGVVGAYIKVKVGEGPKNQPGSRVLTAYLATTPLVQQIWRIRDKLMSLYVPDQGRTVATRLWEDENGKRMFREEKYHDGGVQVVEKRPDQERAFDVQSQPPLLDGFSALFELRRRPLQPDTVEPARIYLNRKIYDCAAAVRRDTITYQGQDVPVLRVDPVLTYQGKAVNDVSFSFWLSDDDKRVPLKIEADVRYGKLAGTLLPPKESAAVATDG